MISPSGATFVTKGAWKGDFVFANLGGEQLRRLSFDGDKVTRNEALLEGEYGRLRDVAEGPDGALYVLTSNRDGRGDPDDERRPHPQAHAALTTLGTAGHIDHGKTVLVRALTGVDTDRLPEEQERGISIELGYAPLELPSGRRLSVVDVPGHERFVRTMVAGATGIDLFLMVVAADDGVMPQTREHAAVLAALGLTAGVVAVTKADLADPARAAAEAAELLPGAEVVPVAAPAGEGLDELRAALDRVAAGSAGARSGGALRLHVDRSFTIRGAGTVVTGTLWEGTAARGDEVRILPAGNPGPHPLGAGPRRAARARRGGPAGRAQPGRGGARRGRARRRRRGRGRTGRGLPRGRRAVLGDPRRAPRRRHARRRPPRHARDGGAARGARRPLLPAAPGAAARARARRPRRDPLAGAAGHARRRRRPRPRPAAPRPEPRPPRPPRPARARRAGARARKPRPQRRSSTSPLPSPTPPLELEQRLRDAGHEPPPDDDPAALAALREHGRVVRLGRDMHIHRDALAAVTDTVTALIAARRLGHHRRASATSSSTSRRYAQALLELLDAERVTLRVGDERVLRKKSS